MPGAAKLMQLYLASSIEDLQKKAEIEKPKDKNIRTLCNSANNILSKADIQIQNGDEEKAFIFYMRYFNMVQLIRKTAEYRKNKEKYNKMMAADKCNDVMDRLETLKDSLIRRYALMKDAEAAAARDANGPSNCPSRNDSVESKAKTASKAPDSKPSTPSIAPEKRTKTVITSFELYDLLLDRALSVLILDARPRNDFLESHLKHSLCISVPEEVLTPGITALSLRDVLPEESRDLFDKRHLMDFVILLDWRSTEVPTSLTVPLRVLRDAVLKWFGDKVLKSDAMVLHGGYEDWLLRYPTCTTYPQPQIPSPPHSPYLPSLVAADTLDYPNLDEAFLVTPDTSPKQSEPSGDQLFHVPSVDRSKKPSLATCPGSTNQPARYLSKVANGIGPHCETAQWKRVMFPQVDRRLKPSPSPAEDGLELATTRGAPTGGKQEATYRAQSLGKELLDLSRKQLQSEQEFELLRERRSREAEEASRAALQEQEEELRRHIRHIEGSMAAKDKEMAELLKENELMKQQLQEKTLEVEEIIRMEEERKKAHRDLQRLREERKKKELQAKEDLEKKKEATAITEGGSSSVPEKNPAKVKGPPSAGDAVPAIAASPKPEATSSARTAGTMWKNSGLSRSRSFPNLSTAVEEEEDEFGASDGSGFPQFDRTLKPPQSGDAGAENLIKRGRSSDVSSSRVRSISPTLGQEFKHLAGLKNLGNTCYMNATLQCLASTVPLALHFLKGHFSEDINRDCKRDTSRELAREFKKLVSLLYYKDKSVSPTSFKTLMGKAFVVYAGYEQQDAHEFLLNLIDRLHEGLNRAPSRNHTRGFTVDENLPVNGRINQFWCHHIDRNLSVISDLFEGLLLSTLTCLSCQKTSSSFEVFSCLSLPIPHNSGGTCNLQDCLRLFLEAEKMSGEAAWDCPSCKQKRKAEKRMIIARLPKILIIHFNRFRCEGAWQSKKLQTYVQFPIYNFDMNEYVDHTRVETQRRPVYELYAFLNHYGTLAAGHYISYCRSARGGWFMYDDSSVSEVMLSESDKRNAYILFYTSVDARHQFLPR